jgi:hypothetical protein
MLNRILTALSVLLPTLFAVALELVNRKTKTRTFWRFIVVAFGAGISAITALQIHGSDRAHRQEIQQELEEIQTLRAELRQSETEQRASNTYFRAKLEDQAQFCTQAAQLAAGVKVLAETGAEFEKKQFEADLVSDKQLYQFTLTVVTGIRDFSRKL